MEKHLVLAGCGHAHLSVMMSLEDFIKEGIRVTAVSPGDYHYYSGMAPGLLSGYYDRREVRFHVKKMVESRGGRFVRGKVKAVVPGDKYLELEDGTRIHYDAVSFNTGSEIPPGPFIPGSKGVFTVKPIEEFIRAREAILLFRGGRSARIVVAGGGPAGVELAGNLILLSARERVGLEVTLVSGERLLQRFSKRIRDIAIRSLTERGVRVIEGVMVDRLEENEIRLSSGAAIPYDIIFNAIGIKPSGIFRNSGIPAGPDGGLLVNRYLQSVKYPEIFGGGDAIYFEPRPLDKVGVYAVRQNSILRSNLMAFFHRAPMEEFRPQNKYLAILNLGDGTGLLSRSPLIYRGKVAFRLKDRIDRAFMKRFQVSGELQESPDIL